MHACVHAPPPPGQCRVQPSCICTYAADVGHSPSLSPSHTPAPPCQCLRLCPYPADISMGVWMMGHRICFLFDARMFAGRCFTDAFAIWDGSRCAGVCDPAKEYPAYMNDTACTGPYAPGQSTPFHIGHCPKGHALPRRARARQLLRWSLG